MPQDLVLLLMLLLAGGALGAVLGLVLCRYRKKSCENYAKSCRNLSWWVFGFSAIFFLILAGSQLALGKLSFAVAFVGFAVLETVAMAFALVRQRRIANEAPKVVDDRPPTA